jgi:hypothetical protein
MENKNSPFAKAEKDEVIRNSVLIAQQGPLEGQRWSIMNELTIGRAPECDIQIPDRQVSRIHARIYPAEDAVELEDLGSKNGTFLGTKDPRKSRLDRWHNFPDRSGAKVCLLYL